MKIGQLQLCDKPVLLAPMEDVTDPSFRQLCKDFGADMVYTEFVSADALIRHVNRTKRKLEIADSERPVAIQIYGKEADTMSEAAKLVAEANPDIIDLNFGCPVRKVAMKGAGAALLKDIPKMIDIAGSVAKAVNIPVTAKTRIGWDDTSIDILNVTEQLQDAGMQAIALHGRTREQMYTGKADWNWIAKAKNNPRLTIPLIGNGDIDSAQKAKQAFDCGVDAIMIGRGCIGRPWIFKEVKHFLETGTELPSIPKREQIEVLKKQIILAIDWLDEFRGILHSRRHLAASVTFKGISNFKPLRIKMLRAGTQQELMETLDEIKHTYFKTE